MGMRDNMTITTKYLKFIYLFSFNMMYSKANNSCFIANFTFAIFFEVLDSFITVVKSNIFTFSSEGILSHQSMITKEAN